MGMAFSFSVTKSMAHRWFEKIYLVVFFIAHVQWDQFHEGRIYFGSWFIQSIMLGKAGQQRPYISSHSSANVLLSLSIQPSTPVCGAVLVTFRVGLSSLVNLSGNLPTDRHTQTYLSPVILNPVKLTVKMNGWMWENISWSNNFSSLPSEFER